MAVVANVKWLFFIQIILFSLLNSAFGDYDTCEAKGPCRCEYYNGSIIDLSSLSVKDNFYTASNVLHTNFNGSNIMLNMHFFYFHPCGNIALGFNDSNNDCNSSSLCYRNVQLVKNNQTDFKLVNVGTDNYQNVGSTKNVKFHGGQNGVSLVYSNLPTSYTIMLVCSPNTNTILTIVDMSPPQPVLALLSPAACLLEVEVNHHSAGTTFVIVLLVMALVYLIFGSLVKHFLMGAQGVEVIPNITFWRDLPNLMRDGIEFIRNGFKPPPQTGSSSAGQAPNPNSYDSI